jgi:hypothetical protein
MRQSNYGRWLSHRGNEIKMHRSMRVLEFPRSRWLEVSLLPLGFNGLTLLLLGALTGFWNDFFLFWLQRMDIAGGVEQATLLHIGGQAVAIPALLLPGVAPTAIGWLLHAAVAVCVLLASLWLPERHLPWRYILRFLVMIHGTALLYFAFDPDSFPYDVESYTRDGLISAIVFLFIVPWLLAMTYYIYDFSVARKVGVTALMLSYFAVFAPAQLLAHALCLHAFSALMLPILYLAFGAFLTVMLFMALYAWAMSL